MSISSISLTVQYSNTADMARARSAAAPAPAAERVPAQAPTQSSCGDHGGCDSPRRSPLYRALIGALSSMVNQPQASNSNAPGSAPAVATATPAAAASVGDAAASAEQASDMVIAPAATPAKTGPIDFEQALMNFAHALTQALRGGRESDDGGEREGRGRGHHHHHHHDHDYHRRDHGRASWGDPAQRIAQLGAQMGAPATAAVAATPAAEVSAVNNEMPVAAAVDSEPAIVPVGDNVQTPVDATDSLATAASAPAAQPVVNLNIYVTLPWASPVSQAKQGLVDAFGSLQQSLGLPPADGPSLKAQLSAFLQALADKLRDGDETANAMTRAGALLSVTA